jgi:hypothetical protein
MEQPGIQRKELKRLQEIPGLKYASEYCNVPGNWLAYFHISIYLLFVLSYVVADAYYICKTLTVPLAKKDDEPNLTMVYKSILNQVRNHHAAWPFLKPVDRNEVPDYYEHIPFPMGK